MNDEKFMVGWRGVVGQLRWWLSERGGMSGQRGPPVDRLHGARRLRLRPRSQATVEHRPRLLRTHPPPTTS